MKKYNVAILGATGLVGQTMISILEERNFPIDNLYPLASSSSLEKTVIYKNRNLLVIDAKEFDWSSCDIALFSAGKDVSIKYAEAATKAGCIIIDNTSAFRYEEDIPLVVTEVNPEEIANYKNRNIIANPNCSTIQMLVALKPIHDKYKIKKANISTYQSVSGSGNKAISELISQCGELLNGRPADAKIYPRQIAFNVIPHIDKFMDNGFTFEEMKMVLETQKILDKNLIVNPTAVRVPVIYGHSESINLELENSAKVDEVRKLLNSSPGISVIDDIASEEYPTPIPDCGDSDEVFVGRIRSGIVDDKVLNLWVVSNNIRKGAALNSVQIAEILIKNYL